MAFIQLSGLSLAFADRDILKNGNLFLKNGCKAALCGANGSGKSTLLRIISGETHADFGERVLEKGSRVSYLPQLGLVHKGKTLFEEAESAYLYIKVLLEKSEYIGGLLLDSKDDDASTQALLDEQQGLLQRVEESEYYNRTKQIALVLSGLGFKEADFDRNTEEFSGGWQMRIALAKVLLENPDILLLDEPTNYLDIEARSWLEQYLSNFKGAYLLVSHDRYFLDVTVNEIYELFQGKLTRYTGNYSEYQKKRALELEGIVSRYKAQQEEIRKNEDLIRRFRYKATKAAMVQERIKKLSKMEIIEIPEALKKIDIEFPRPPHCGNIALTAQGIEKKYGDKKILSNVDITVESGERLLIVGANGAGKTTLLRIIAGEDRDFTGSVYYGAGIRMGYFTQNTSEIITGDQSVIEFLEESAPTELIPKLRDMLGGFLFRGDDVYKSLNVLSGGEKNRLALLRLLLFPLNILVLDEPTNHLDLYSKDILLSALLQWKGTIIFVSHDRAFMEALSTKTLELKPGAQSRLFYGNYLYYLDRGSSDIEDSMQSSVRADLVKAPASIPSPSKDNGALQFREEQKKLEAAKRRFMREEEKLIQEIDALENKKLSLEAELSKPEVYCSGEKVKIIQEKLIIAIKEIEEATVRWEALSLQG
ncbi:MAG: ABC-F family ATP-binding cassette domain-containing protein [Spirochaetaceae bacterium]|jgi:ATP-binding cassette subfamily F protein 3|nr:ABC-F family ATP-binding cassette domain-containing protein [Spirochaetaceae bacterium]